MTKSIKKGGAVDLVLSVFDWVVYVVGENVAASVGFTAMAFTAYQAYLSRRHNLLSVAPHLVGNTHSNYGAEFNSVRLEVANHGLGPARVVSFSIWRDGRVSAIRNSAELTRLVSGVVEVPCQADSGVMNAGYVLPTGATQLVVALRFAREVPIEVVQDRLAELDLVVRYRCMYGRRFAYDTRSKWHAFASRWLPARAAIVWRMLDCFRHADKKKFRAGLGLSDA